MADYVTPVNQFLKSIDPQPYERYLPNAFNESLSLLEKINKIIHQLNESNQLTNEVVTRWNVFVDWVNNGGLQENITTNIQEFLTDDTLIQLIDTELMSDFKRTIEQTTNRKLDDTQELVNRQTGYYWIPEKQPSIRADEPNHFIDVYTVTPDEIINNHFETLRVSNPDYIKRNSLGKDASGVHDIWEYTYTPKDFEKTMVIVTGMHGSEMTGVIAMIRFLHYLTNEFDKYPQLSYLRQKVRIVHIPIANPWGMAQKPRKRQNSNGVDINRNSDYKHATYVPSQNEPFGHDYKGTTPFSEVEAQYIRDTLKRYEGFSTFIDFHNTGEYLYDFYVSMPEFYKYKTFDGLVEYFSKNKVNPKLQLARDPMPSFTNHVYHTYNVPASTTEWNEGSTGHKKYGDLDFTDALTWFSNTIFEHAREFETPQKPILRENYYSRAGANINLPIGAYAEIPDLHFEMDAPFDGFIIATGMVILTPSDLTSNNFVCPVISQEGTSFGTFRQNAPRNEMYGTGVSKLLIPFQAQQHIVKGIPIKYGLFGYTSAATSTIYRYRVKFLLIPVENSKPQFKMYSANGREGQGYEAMINVPI